MAAPGTAVLSFGLVAIPLRILSAIKDQGVHFNWLHAKCGSRIRNQTFCPVCKKTVERDELVRGYEISDNHYIKFTEGELDNLVFAEARWLGAFGSKQSKNKRVAIKTRKFRSVLDAQDAFVKRAIRLQESPSEKFLAGLFLAQRIFGVDAHSTRGYNNETSRSPTHVLRRITQLAAAFAKDG
jgi:Ku70/Ku80 beta-barrel domain